MFIDELDAIAPARKDGGEELSQRMVATLLNSIDEISRTDGLVVIAATNRPNSIEPAVRRPGRLDREIELGNIRIDFIYFHVENFFRDTSTFCFRFCLISHSVSPILLAIHPFVFSDSSECYNMSICSCIIFKMFRLHVHSLIQNTKVSEIFLNDWHLAW